MFVFAKVILKTLLVPFFPDTVRPRCEYCMSHTACSVCLCVGHTA